MNKKEKRLEKRLSKENDMRQYLLNKGWECVGPLKDVWQLAGWKSNEVCYLSLHKAFRNQKRLDAQGYKRPAGVDTDLGSLIMGD